LASISRAVRQRFGDRVAQRHPAARALERQSLGPAERWRIPLREVLGCRVHDGRTGWCPHCDLRACEHEGFLPTMNHVPIAREDAGETTSVREEMWRSREVGLDLFERARLGRPALESDLSQIAVEEARRHGRYLPEVAFLRDGVRESPVEGDDVGMRDRQQT